MKHEGITPPECPICHKHDSIMVAGGESYRTIGGYKVTVPVVYICTACKCGFDKDGNILPVDGVDKIKPLNMDNLGISMSAEVKGEDNDE